MTVPFTRESFTLDGLLVRQQLLIGGSWQDASGRGTFRGG